MRGAATGLAAFQKGRRCLDEDLNLQPSIQAGHSISTLAKSPKSWIFHVYALVEGGGRFAGRSANPCSQ